MPNWTGGRLSGYFAYHSPDFLYRSATIDFRYKGMPGFGFGRFYSAPGFGPDDTEIFYISRSGGCFYFSSSFSSTTNGVSCIHHLAKQDHVF